MCSQDCILKSCIVDSYHIFCSWMIISDRIVSQIRLLFWAFQVIWISFLCIVVLSQQRSPDHRRSCNGVGLFCAKENTFVRDLIKPSIHVARSFYWPGMFDNNPYWETNTSLWNAQCGICFIVSSLQLASNSFKTIPTDLVVCTQYKTYKFLTG